MLAPPFFTLYALNRGDRDCGLDRDSSITVKLVG
jgi:hypothetical protein